MQGSRPRLALCVCLTLVVCAAFSRLSDTSAGEAAAESVRARSLEIIDGAGRPRIRLEAVGDAGSPRIRMLDEDGRCRLSLWVGADGADLEIRTAGGAVVAEIESRGEMGRVCVGSPTGTRGTAWLHAGDEALGPGLLVSDGRHQARASVSLHGRRQDPMILLGDPDGATLFRAPPR